MAQHWQFRQDEEQQWHWKRLDDNSGATESPGTFAKPIDCFLDAVQRVVRDRRAGGDGGDHTH